MSNPNEIVWFHKGDIQLRAHIDAYYVSEQKPHSWSTELFILGSLKASNGEDLPQV